MLAARLLRAVRAGSDPAAVAAAVALAGLAPDALATDLADDTVRIATWLNLYNAAAQRLVAGDPAGYARRVRFFRRPAIEVAGTSLEP